MILTLKQARLVSELTQKDMAEYLEICEDTYRKLERNPGIVTIEQAKKISDKLNVSYNDIFFAD